MIPFMPRLQSSIAAPMKIRFTGDARSATMGTGGSIDVTVTYELPGTTFEFISWYASNALSGNEWENSGVVGPIDSYSGYKTFTSASSTVWVGAGVYKFWAVAYNSGYVGVAAAEEITLTVT